jgi:hypothetical protein
MAFDNNVDIVDSYALSQGLISAVGASLSGILGGAIADRIVVMSSSSPSSTTTTTTTTMDDDAQTTSSTTGSSGNSNTSTITITSTSNIQNRLWVPVVGSFLAAPAWYWALHTASADTFTTSMTWLAVEYFVAECWFGPTISVLQATTVLSARGTAQGLFTLTGALANLAPTALGIAISSDDGPGVATELLDLLSNGVCVAYILSSLCFIMAIRAPAPANETALPLK